MYMAAWDQNIRHISVMNTIFLQSHTRAMAIKTFSTEQEYQRVLKENVEFYEKQKELEGDPDDVFSWEAFKVVIG